MPELPDLLYIRTYLRQSIQGRTITGTVVQQPVVLRIAVQESLDKALTGKRIVQIDLRGPFLRLELSGALDIVMNLMLMGRLQHHRPGEKKEPYCCVSLLLDDSSRLNLCDEQRMAKCYIVPHGQYAAIPAYTTQGIDIRGPAFTADAFRDLALKHRRQQVRVFINDHTILSSIGNAYADEILFDAKIHPKTFVGSLSPEQLDVLFGSIRSVMDNGIKHVEAASQAIHVKVRDHMKVRMRRGEPCPRCGSRIRREGVRGHDVFFCPHCQPSSRRLFLDWRKV